MVKKLRAIFGEIKVVKMNWEDILKDEGFSEEHKERLRSMRSSKQPMFDVQDSPMNMLYKKVYEIIDFEKLEQFLQMSKAHYMRAYDVKNFSPPSLSQNNENKLINTLERILEDELGSYVEEARKNQGENPLPKYDPKGI